MTQSLHNEDSIIDLRRHLLGDVGIEVAFRGRKGGGTVESLSAFRVQRAAVSMRRWAALLPVLLCIRDAAAPMLP